MSKNSNTTLEAGKKSGAKKHSGKKPAKPNASLTRDDKIKLYRDMVRIRRFEERSLHSYQQGRIGGFLHLYIGQESIAVATASLMEDNDHLITAYRDHGNALSVGMTMNECMAELYGRFTGCSKGKGGSMHYFAPDKNFWGGHGIVGGQTPLGTGIAFALKYKKLKGCCLCLLGDGAVNQGAYLESLNLAALWNLPVIYVIENNRYSMGTSQKRSSAGAPLARRAESYDMDWEVIDGSSVYEIREKLSPLMERARNDCTPSVVEIQTYRYRGHSVADANAEKYRSKKEIEDYKKNHDPIMLFEKTLIKEGVLTDATIEEIDREAKKEATDAAKFADESPYPPQEEIFTDVYWEIDHRTGKNEGRIFFND